MFCDFLLPFLPPRFPSSELIYRSKLTPAEKTVEPEIRFAIKGIQEDAQ